jgi:beta-glucanase (GH16 family)
LREPLPARVLRTPAVSQLARDSQILGDPSRLPGIAANPVRATKTRWRLVWRDEFEGDAIDPAKWDFDIGNAFYDHERNEWLPGWGNEELQYYTRDPANAFVRDSVLTIRALKRPLHGCRYTSARLKTRRRDGKPLLARQYGRFEIRARLPHGKGVWPALWLMPLADSYGSWAASGELDVMEIRGDQPGHVLGTIHFGSSAPKNVYSTHTLQLPAGCAVSDWHVYAVEWEPGNICWLFDGKVWARENFWWSCSRTRSGRGLAAGRAADLNPWPAPFDQPFYLIMNVAVGGVFPGAPDRSTRFPADLQVDYVRVYDKVGGYGPPRRRGRGRLPFRKKR